MIAKMTKSHDQLYIKSGPEVIKLFSYSTQLSTKYILLINVKMLTIVGILTFISMINTTSERFKARNFLNEPWHDLVCATHRLLRAFASRLSILY